MSEDVMGMNGMGMNGMGMTGMGMTGMGVRHRRPADEGGQQYDERSKCPDQTHVSDLR